MDADRDGHITEADLTELAALLEKAGGRPLDTKSTWLEMVTENKKLEAAHFAEWALNHRASPLVRWIFEVEHRLTNPPSQSQWSNQDTSGLVSLVEQSYFKVRSG